MRTQLNMAQKQPIPQFSSQQPQTERDFKLRIAIDFGTHGTGIHHVQNIHQ